MNKIIKTKEVVISLGSNINPEVNINDSITLLSKTFQITKLSKPLRTKSVGDTSQPDYINQCALISTDLSYIDIRNKLKKIEDDLGRKRDPNNVNIARTIDLDIIIVDKYVIDKDFFDKDFVKILVEELLDEVII